MASRKTVRDEVVQQLKDAGIPGELVTVHDDYVIVYTNNFTKNTHTAYCLKHERPRRLCAGTAFRKKRSLEILEEMIVKLREDNPRLCVHCNRKTTGMEPRLARSRREGGYRMSV